MTPAFHLPDTAALRPTAQALAMLDAILSPEWESRCFSFNASWAAREAMASMRNGEGDEWFLWFGPPGTALKGFAHALPHGNALASAIQAQLPEAFSSFKHEPAFELDATSFCFWRGLGDGAWQQVSGGLHPDGAAALIAPLTAGPVAHQAWAEDYFGRRVQLAAVQAVFAHQTLDATRMRALNPKADWAFTQTQAQEIGFPCA